MAFETSAHHWVGRAIEPPHALQFRAEPSGQLDVGYQFPHPTHVCLDVLITLHSWMVRVAHIALVFHWPAIGKP